MNRFVSLAAACIVALTFFSTASYAQQISESHAAASRRVIVDSGMSRSFDNLLPEVQNAMRRQLLTQPSLAKDLDEVFEALEPEMELQRRAMINIAASIMAQQIPEEDLTLIAEFFATPAGKRYVDAQPVILDDMLIAMRAWQQDIAEYIQVRVRAEMQKRGHQMN